jgi:hypothetical protein
MSTRVLTTAAALAAALLLAALLAAAPGRADAAAASAGTAAATSGDPVARAARSCRPPRYPGSGYFTSLRVTRIGCSTGSRLALSHYRCRVRSGASGRCRARVSGYRCSERRRAVSTEFNAVVTCRRGARRAVFSYQQNT